VLFAFFIEGAVFQNIVFMVMLFAALFPLPLSAGEKIVNINTRSGIALNLLISTPESMNGTAIIMFLGGDGSSRFTLEDGRIKRGDNFLMRTVPGFTNRGFLVVVVGMPSDRPEGMDDDFRLSAEHLQDIAGVVDFIAKQGGLSIYLVGTSRGTISTAYLSTALRHRDVAGVIFTSTVKDSKFLRWIPLEETAYPVLLVHHRGDNCKWTPFSEAEQLSRRFKNSSRVDFEAVEGGSTPLSDPCNALSAHGFFGIEEKVMEIMVGWMTTISQKKSS